MENVEKFVFMLFCFQKQRKQPEITSSGCLKILYVQTLLKMPFSSEQEKLIILLFGRFQSSTQVRREFIKHQNLKGRQASELRTQDFDWIFHSLACMLPWFEPLGLLLLGHGFLWGLSNQPWDTARCYGSGYCCLRYSRESGSKEKCSQYSEKTRKMRPTRWWAFPAFGEVKVLFWSRFWNFHFSTLPCINLSFLCPKLCL